MLLCKELIVAEDSPHITMQRIITFECGFGVLAGVSVLGHTAQALVFLLVPVCWDTSQALVFLLVSVCWDTAQAVVFLLVSVCWDTAQASNI